MALKPHVESRNKPKHIFFVILISYFIKIVLYLYKYTPVSLWINIIY